MLLKQLMAETALGALAPKAVEFHKDITKYIGSLHYPNFVGTWMKLDGTHGPVTKVKTASVKVAARPKVKFTKFGHSDKEVDDMYGVLGTVDGKNAFAIHKNGKQVCVYIVVD
jgi:hypothetical protein